MPRPLPSTPSPRIVHNHPISRLRVSCVNNKAPLNKLSQLKEILRTSTVQPLTLNGKNVSKLKRNSERHLSRRIQTAITVLMTSNNFSHITLNLLTFCSLICWQLALLERQSELSINQTEQTSREKRLRELLGRRKTWRQNFIDTCSACVCAHSISIVREVKLCCVLLRFAKSQGGLQTR